MTQLNGTSRSVASPRHHSSRSLEQEKTISRWLRWAIEAVTLGMIVGSPWALGCADPPFEFYLHVCVGIIAVLWAVRMAIQTRLQWQFSPVAVLPPGYFCPWPLSTRSSSAEFVECDFTDIKRTSWTIFYPIRLRSSPWFGSRCQILTPPNHTLSLVPLPRATPSLSCLLFWCS